jgi:hypothetical protein
MFLAQQRLKPLAHLIRRLVRESHSGDLVRLEPMVLYEIRHPGGENASFA